MMIAHKWINLIPLLVLGVCGRFDIVRGERWSRQVSNSEWIPLADPTTFRTQIPFNNAAENLPPVIQSLTLPPALQQQYQEQLLQLQKTQESIQKLLLLQQQLKAQQQILQSQAYLPSSLRGLVEPTNKKEGSQQSAIVNVESLPELSPASMVLPDRNFVPPTGPTSKPIDNEQSTGKAVKDSDENRHGNERNRNEASGAERLEPKLDHTKERNNFHDGSKRLRTHNNPQLGPYVTSKTIYENEEAEPADDEEEEVQLVYVPAEALKQRNQPKRGRNRKQQYVTRTHQSYQEARDEDGNDNAKDIPMLHNEEDFARQLILRLQKEREEGTKSVEFMHHTPIQQEDKEYEEEYQQRAAGETAKNMKVLEALEELAKQRELERIHATREKLRREEMERIKQLEIRAKKEEEERKETDRLAALERQKQMEIRERLEERKKVERQGLRARQQQQSAALSSGIENSSRDQIYRQHLTETSQIAKKGGKSRVRQRPRNPKGQNSEETRPSANQPPLSVYISAGPHSITNSLHVSDVLKILKDAKTIAVLDTIGPHSPRVFVGPANLETTTNYAKFELPYLSSLDNNRVERKVDKLPFFVAPLSFEPPVGYSKIPFPAPHIGSVVVNTLDVDEEEPNPLVQTNSYVEPSAPASPSPATPVFHNRQSTTTANYPPSLLQNAEVLTSRHRLKHLYGDAKSIVETTTSRPKLKSAHYYDDRGSGLAPTAPNAQIFQDTVLRGSGGSSPEVLTHLDLENQHSPKDRVLPLIREDHHLRRPDESTDDTAYVEISIGGITETRNLPGSPTEYNLPAKLPAISPHLPGLINSLLEDRQTNAATELTTPETLPTTATTTLPTTEATIITTVSTPPPHLPSTTYRTRGRQRGRTTGVRTTTAVTEYPTASARRPAVERSRRPYNRSRSRYTTTTEEYRDQTYNPTKKSILEDVTEKYSNVDYRRPLARVPKFRMRDKSAQVTTRKPNVENQGDFVDVKSGTNLSKQPETNVSDVILQDGIHSGDRQSVQRLYKTTNSFSHIPGNPVEATQTEPTVIAPSSPSGYPFYSDKGENVEQKSVYGMQDSSGAPTGEQSESPMYQDSFEKVAGDADTSPPATFVPLERDNPRDYNIAGSLSTVSSALQERIQGMEHESTTEMPSLTTRQRTRSRNIGGRVQHESVVQTRAKTNQDEYVRVGVGNHSPIQRNRDPLKARLRLRGQSHNSPQVQTEGEEYIRIQGNRRLTASTAATAMTMTVTTTTTTTTPSPPPTSTYSQDVEDENDYGFIRAPNFRSTMPLDSGFHSSLLNYRPLTLQGQHVYRKTEIPVTSIFIGGDGEGESENVGEGEIEGEARQDYVNHKKPKYTEVSTHRTTAKPLTESNVMPVDTGNYPTQIDYSRSRSEENEKTNSGKPRRGRGRRPGRKRPTPSTEPTFDAHNNEVPLDENYPRPLQTPMNSDSTRPRESIYNDNSDGPSTELIVDGNPIPSLRLVRPLDYHQTTDDENYGSEAFVLNFGNAPSEYTARGEYGETGQTSEGEKYRHDTHSRLETPEYNGDIYGEESQWSTKLTGTASLRSSLPPNRLVNEEKEKLRVTTGSNVIAVSPDTTTITAVISSADERYSLQLDSVTDNATTMHPTFGRKVESYNTTTEGIERPAEIPSEKQLDRSNTIRYNVNYDTQRESSATDLRKISSNVPTRHNVGEDSPKEHATSHHGKTKRRRVRVRVRPIDDDFLSAESQHFNSAFNSLIDSQYKYESFRQNRPTTTTAQTTTGKNSFDNLSDHEWPEETTVPRDEIKNDDESVASVEATTSTTELSVDTWTTPLITFPTVEIRTEARNETIFRDDATISSPPLVELRKPDIETPVEEFQTEIEKEKINDERDSGNGFSQTDNDEELHPANHRAQWSEVRYLSEQLLTTTNSPKIVNGKVNGDTERKVDTNVQTLSDYVRAIFENIKYGNATTTARTTTMTTFSDTPNYNNSQQTMESPNEENNSTSNVPTDAEDTEKMQGSEKHEEEGEISIDLESDAESTTIRRVNSYPEVTSNVPFSTGVSILPTTKSTISKPTKSYSAILMDTGKVLRTQTTTKVSHMTEICYRGRCVMTKPKREIHAR